jgi:hypothetical protein
MADLMVIFTYQGNPLTMQCKSNEIVDNVFQRYCQKARLNIDDVKFYYNSSQVYQSGKTLEALGVKNLFGFNVVREKYVNGAN